MKIEIEKEEINLNNNSVENSEILFWKLFHNKFIRSYIFNQIEEINKSINKRTGCEIKKFKNIKSLGWLIKNKQLSLLKCKLERDDEKVIIEKDDILSLFKEILKYSKFPNNYYYNYTYGRNEDYIPNIELRLETKIFKLLLKFRLNEIMMKFKLIDIIMDMEICYQYYYQCDAVYENVILNQLLFNEPYCNLIRIDEKTIELVIKNSRSTTLLKKVLLNLKNRRDGSIYDKVINDNVKNKSISWVSCMQYEKYKDEMYKFILNDQSLYNIPHHNNHSTPSISKLHKRLKSSKPTNNNNNNNQDSHHNVVRIDIKSLFDIDSPIIQKKLLKLNYFKISKENDYSEDFKLKISNILNNDGEQHWWNKNDKSYNLTNYYKIIIFYFLFFILFFFIYYFQK